MDYNTRKYRGAELLAACPLPILSGDNGIIRIKIKSKLGESKWLNITSQEFKAIEHVLYGISEQTK